MTVDEVAKRVGRTKWAIYKAIEKGYGIGLIFERRPGKGWFAYARDVRRFEK